MLSYRHSFHAGNFGDVLKHVVLVEVLEHLTQKDTPFDYVDTHAGAGLFDLRSDDARKLQEHVAGIGKLDPAQFPELARYFEVIRSFNQPGSLDFYPGSPSIARSFLRPRDRAWLFELHPRDHELLVETMRGARNVRIARQDGLQGLMALLPPVSRRGLVLIDPSYEIKADYDRVVEVLPRAHAKFRTGVYALWYPVVDRDRVEGMQRRLAVSGIRDILQLELGVAPDSTGLGMTSAGMFVINPPWKLFERMSALLPRLARALAEDGTFRCDVLVPE